MSPPTGYIVPIDLMRCGNFQTALEDIALYDINHLKKICLHVPA